MARGLVAGLELVLQTRVQQQQDAARMSRKERGRSGGVTAQALLALPVKRSAWLFN